MSDDKKAAEHVYTVAERLNLIEQAKLAEIQKRQAAVAMDLWMRESALRAQLREQQLDFILGRRLMPPIVPRNGTHA